MTPFWRRPKWLVGHVLCLALVLLFVRLGFWQIHRLHEKEARRDLVHSRMAAPPEPLDRVLAGDPTAAQVAYRRVSATGTWDGQTLLVRSRSLDGRPGYFVLGILRTSAGHGIVVNRGFAASGGGGEAAIRQAAAVRSSSAKIEGILRPPERRTTFGAKDPATGHLDVLNRVDVARIQQQTPGLDLGSSALQLTAPKPPPEGVPELLPPPATDLGPHKSYAAQWFIFATVGAVGWPMLLRRTAAEEAKRRAGEVASA